MFYFSQSSFFREIYKTSFFAGVKHKNLQKSKNLPLQTLLFSHLKFVSYWIPMCCENFGRFHRRKFKIITNKAIQRQKTHLFGQRSKLRQFWSPWQVEKIFGDQNSGESRQLATNRLKEKVT